MMGWCPYGGEEWCHNIDECQYYEEERPHGEWKYNPDCVNDEMQAIFYCSICNSGAYSRHDNFCPNCGASMSANDRQVTGKLNSEIEKGWRLKEGDEK